MASFVYTARDRQGSALNGLLEAVNEDEVLTTLQTRGLTVTKIARKESLASQVARRRLGRDLHNRVTDDDLVTLCQQLAVLLEAGVPLLRALEVICAQVESRRLLKALEQIRTDVQSGRSFCQALTRHPNIFSNFWINVVETGEASGHLPQTLNHLARYLERNRDLRRKAVTATVYPQVLLAAIVVAVAVFVIWIIPVFSDLFESMDMELPWLTRMVVTASDVARHHLVLVIIGAVAGGLALRQFFRSSQGRWIVDRASLKVPVFNRLFMQLHLTQFAQGMAALLESDTPILFGLEIMQRSATNSVYAKAIEQVREAVRAGRTMAEPMEDTGVFPPMMVQMVRVGEEVGDLGKMLDRLARFYESRVSAFIERLSVLFEPIAIFLMAGVVGTLVLAMFLPMFQLAGGFQAPK